MKTIDTVGHTPGPWHLRETRFPDGRNGFTCTGNDSRGNNNVPVAEIPEWFFRNLGTPDIHTANARLIAAAPSLLAALAMFEQGPPDNDNTDAWFAQYALNLEHARAAISQATHP